MTIVGTEDSGDKAVTLRVRGGDGRLRRTKANAERASQACELYAQGWTFQRIADHLGYATKGNVHRDVKRVLAETQSAGVELLRQKHGALLDRLLGKAIEIMERDHIAHSQGRIVRIGCPGLDRGEVQHSGCTYGVPGAPYCDGPALLDHGPKLQAINVAKGLLERSAKLHGLDAPVRTAIEGDELVIRIKGVDTDAV